MAKVVVLNTTEAYVSDVTSITDVLTTGLYVKEDPMIVTGFDSAVHTLAIVTAAADVKILDIVYGIGGYAIWKVYKVVEVEVEWGYVVITITATGTVVRNSGDYERRARRGAPLLFRVRAGNAVHRPR
jgi:hypothetical protein